MNKISKINKESTYRLAVLNIFFRVPLEYNIIDQSRIPLMIKNRTIQALHS